MYFINDLKFKSVVLIIFLSYRTSVNTEKIKKCYRPVKKVNMKVFGGGGGCVCKRMRSRGGEGRGRLIEVS